MQFCDVLTWKDAGVLAKLSNPVTNRSNIRIQGGANVDLQFEPTVAPSCILSQDEFFSAVVKWQLSGQCVESILGFLCFGCSFKSLLTGHFCTLSLDFISQYHIEEKSRTYERMSFSDNTARIEMQRQYPIIAKQINNLNVLKANLQVTIQMCNFSNKGCCS